MKLLLISILFLFRAHAYLSYGDASDDCSFTSTQTLTKSIWNCDDLVVSAGAVITFSSAASDPIQFRVKGTATIDGTITVSASGTTPGPGGSAGGDCATAECDGVNAPGSTTGEGGGGQKGDGFGVGDAFAGAGGGAGFSNAGNVGAAGAGGSGTADGVGGSAGSSFVTVGGLETSLAGGVGGGAGGTSEDDSASTRGPGGDGGAGSGSIAIISKGDVTFGGSALINAAGGIGDEGLIAPSGGTSYGGDGGGGSGGAIYIVSGGNVSSANADLNINGGNELADTDASSAEGGRGSDGIVSIDDIDGALTGVFDFVAPNTDGITAVVGTTPAGILDPPRAVAGSDLSSDIEAACTYKEEADFQLLNSLFSFIFSIILLSFFTRKNFRFLSLK